MPTPASASSDLSSERRLQRDLRQSQGLLVKIGVRQQAGQAVRFEIARLKELATGIQVSDQLLRQRFVARDGVAGGLGAVAVIRQAAMHAEYTEFLDRYLTAITTMPDDAVPTHLLANLESLLTSLLPEHPLPLLGTLPYRHLRLPSQLPLLSPAFTPAYRGGKVVVSAADLAESPEAPTSAEIATLA